MEMKFNYQNGTRKIQNDIIDAETVASFITMAGAVLPDSSADLCDRLIETGINGISEMVITVNGVTLNTERIMERLAVIINSQKEVEADET